MSAAAAVGCCLPGPSLYTSPRDDEDRTTRARSGSDLDSSSGSWLPNKAALPQCSARLLAAFLFVTSVTFTTAATSGITATGSVHRRGQARAVHRSRLARSGRGQKSTCFGSTHLLQPPFGCAAAAAAPRRVMSRWGRRHWANGLGRRRPCSAALKTGRNGVSAPPSMDSGDLDAMVQAIAPATSAPINTGVSLNPAQEACALLDPETPAILLTAGAGTGKTHTLAARLAYLLGVKIRRPALGEQKEGAVVAGDIGRLDRTDWLAGVFAGGGGMGEASAHAAAPENVLVLSFTHQGVQDVRDRAVAAGLPMAQGDRVWAATFHSFAATVLKQNANLVWPNPASASPNFSKGVDIIGRTEQVDLLATALAGPKERVDLPPSTGDTFLSATGGAFEGTWSGTDGFGGSWGMPPSSEERGEEAARRRKASATRAKAVLSRLTLWKEQGLTPEDVRDGKAKIADETDKAAAGVYSRYQGLLRSRGQVDFGDLCMMATDLFVRHPEVLERYRWRLRHVLVDEYQDTSPAQQRLLRALVLGTPSVATAAGDESVPPPPTSRDPATARLAGEAEEEGEGGAWGKGAARAGASLDKHPGLGVSLFCTGDEDQHIYGWRGTTVDHLHSFEEDFPGAVRCALTETHRLPVHLLRSSTGLMRAGGLVPLLNNRMKTRQNTGAVVRAQGLWNSREEGKWVAVEARKMHREQGISYKDMAVISRTAYNTRELEESLAARGVPYAVEGGSSFFSRSEVQAPLALLALCANPQDDAAFRRVISLRLQSRLLRWATPATMRGVGELAVAEGVSFAEAVRLSVSRGQVKGGDASAFIYGLRRWSSLLMGWPKLHDVERGAAVWRIFSEAGFLPPSGENIFASLGGSMGGGGPGGGVKMTQDEESIGQLATAASRCDHIGRFLLRAARAREEAAEKQGARKRGGEGGRWEGTTGNGEQRTSRRSEDSLEMMTMHQAKGREFKVVFLTGWDEGSFPLLPSTGDRDHVVESLERLHEERRLGYVALTRASQNAIITFSKKRRFRNSWVHSSGPSRFLLDMPTEFVEVLPDAIGRALNDYPGLAGSHTLAFDGLVQAGKLRRSRPVLPPDSELRALQSSPRHRENGGDTLPPGCTIVNRNDGFGDANTNSKSLLTTRKVLSSSDARTKGTDTLTTDTTSAATAVAAAAAVGAAAAGAAATENSSLADFAGSRPSSADTLSADPSAPAAPPQRHSFGDKQVGDDLPPAAPRPSASNPNSASPEDVVVSAAPTGAIDTGDVPGGMAATAAPVRLEAPTLMENPAEIEATRREPMSDPRQKEAATTTTMVVTQPPPPPPPRLVDAGTAEGLTRVLYNPGPTFRRARGRKKKTLLDASRVTVDDTIGSEKVLALAADPTVQQASLKNYLRAVLAIQHGCVRGSIPVSRPSGGKPSKEAPATARKAASRGGLIEKGATGRAALSTCSAHELASYIVVLLDAREKE